MRWLSSLLSVLLLLSGSLATKRSSVDRFPKYHAKSLTSSPIKLDNAIYKDLTQSPRGYSVVILLTAMDPRLGCQMCREFQPEWDVLARSWTKGDKLGASRTIFGTLDFQDGRDVFVSLGLQSAPVLLVFRPTVGPNSVSSLEPARYDFVNGPQSAEQMHAWITRQLHGDGSYPPLKRPVDWMRWIMSMTTLVGFIGILFIASPYVLPIIQSRSLWAAGSLISILLFTSGHMFNHIRKVPYVAGDGRGNIVYFAKGFQSQFGLETQIVAAMYGILAFTAIALATKVPRISDPRTQQFSIVMYGSALFFINSFLLSVFRVKNPSYPFATPPFM